MLLAMTPNSLLSRKTNLLIAVLLCAFVASACAQKVRVPVVHSNMEKKGGKIQIEASGRIFVEKNVDTPLSLENMRGNPTGNEVISSKDFIKKMKKFIGKTK